MKEASRWVSWGIPSAVEESHLTAATVSDSSIDLGSQTTAAIPRQEIDSSSINNKHQDVRPSALQLLTCAALQLMNPGANLTRSNTLRARSEQEEGL